MIKQITGTKKEREVTDWKRRVGRPEEYIQSGILDQILEEKDIGEKLTNTNVFV